MVERLVRGGHRVVGYDRDAGAVARVRRGGRRRAPIRSQTWPAKLRASRARSGSWFRPARRSMKRLPRSLPHLSKDDILIDGGNSNYKDTQRRAREPEGAGISVCGRGHQRRNLGTQGRLLDDGGRRQSRRRASAAHSSKRWRPAKDQGWGHVGPSGVGPLRQDGSQRHRIRNDAGVCRRLRDPEKEKRIRARHAPGFGNLADGKRGAFLAAGFAQHRAEGKSGDGGHRAVRCRIPEKAAGRWRKRSIWTCPLR